MQLYLHNVVATVWVAPYTQSSVPGLNRNHTPVNITLKEAYSQLHTAKEYHKR